MGLRQGFCWRLWLENRLRMGSRLSLGFYWMSGLWFLLILSLRLLGLWLGPLWRGLGLRLGLAFGLKFFFGFGMQSLWFWCQQGLRFLPSC